MSPRVGGGGGGGSNIQVNMFLGCTSEKCRHMKFLLVLVPGAHSWCVPKHITHTHPVNKKSAFNVSIFPVSRGVGLFANIFLSRFFHIFFCIASTSSRGTLNGNTCLDCCYQQNCSNQGRSLTACLVHSPPSMNQRCCKSTGLTSLRHQNIISARCISAACSMQRYAGNRHKTSRHTEQHHNSTEKQDMRRTYKTIVGCVRVTTTAVENQ